MINKLIGNWVIQLFCIFWAVFLFLDYINHSGYFVKAWKYNVYFDFIFVYFICAAGIAYIFSNRKSIAAEVEIKNFRGIYHYGFIVTTMGLLMAFYLVKSSIVPNALSGTFSFIIRTLLFHAAFGVILISAWSIGSFVLSKLSVNPDVSTKALISIGIGFFIITTGLFLLGALGILYQFVVFPFILLLIIPGWKQTFSAIKEVAIKKSEPFKLHFLAIFTYAFMILLVAITLCFDSKLYPVGFDSLSLYMNTAKLIEGYHSLTQGGDAYNWSLMMSLGMIMYKSTLVSILISVVPGILCLVAIYKIGLTLKLSRSWSIFAAAVFYSLPNTIWQSKNDEKIDLAFLFITLCSIVAFFAIPSSSTNTPIKGNKTFLSRFSPEVTLWAICGVLTGFSFGIKYIAMLSLFAFLVIIFYQYSGKYGAITIFFINFALIFYLDLTKFAAFERELFVMRFLVPLILGLIALAFAIRTNKEGLLTATKRALIFGLAFGITFVPWAIKNVSEHKNISVDNILTGKSPLKELYSDSPPLSDGSEAKFKSHETLTYTGNQITIQQAGIGFIASNDDPSSTKEKIGERRRKKIESMKAAEREAGSINSEKVEEIRRYLGYESGIIRFLSLPYDIVIKNNVRLGSADSGILFLILIPIFLFAFRAKHIHWNILKMSLLLLWLIVSMLSVQFINGPPDFNVVFETLKTSSFKDSELLRGLLLPIYVFTKTQLLLIGNAILPFYQLLTTQGLGACFVIIVLSAIPLYFIFKSTLAGMNKFSRYIILFVYGIIQYWLLLASGIIWYGIAGFSLIPLVVAILATNNNPLSNTNTVFAKRYVSVCTAIWFVLILPFQFIPISFLYQQDVKQIRFAEFMDPPFVKYAIGAQDERQVFKQFFSPAEQNILNTLNRDKKAKLINISTFLKYHIINNDSRVYMDNQLGIYKNISARVSNDKSQVADELRKKEIKYILVGLNAAKIDRTKDKTLTKKFDDLMNTLINNPEVRLLYTNRLVKRPDGDMQTVINGVPVITKYDVVGERIIEPGTVALFEIL